MDVSDEDLMLRYRDGDVAAFDELYRRHRGPLYRYVVRQCGNAALADELFQDVWMNLIRSRERYTVQAKFTTYLFRMAHNRIIDHYRKQSRESARAWDVDCDETDALPDPRAVDPETHAGLVAQAGRLLELLGDLPGPQREAFLLREESGLGVDEIAEVTGVNPETAKSRLRYAVAKLRRGLGGES